jgi:phosphatidylglycerol:prolipoprotein diacylglycerol transferase
MGLQNAVSGTVTYHHPTFLYESLWNAAGFVLLHFLSKKRKFDGQIALGYLAWYGLGRTFIEGLRVDSLYWGNFRVSQLLAAASCFIGVALLMVNLFRDHDPAKLQANIYAAKLAQAEEAAQEESADTQE